MALAVTNTVGILLKWSLGILSDSHSLEQNVLVLLTLEIHHPSHFQYQIREAFALRILPFSCNIAHSTCKVY